MLRVVMIPLFALALLAGCSTGTPSTSGGAPQASVGSGGGGDWSYGSGSTD
ncbi:hypothetical protein [Azospirillum doebereinerae]|uniref:hypothetical protein n=1 Tax=Azospirillum doebereinerae TaxID=92933 RepID=UPI00163B7510|nr:hypothetical protein [Azospirillum doebereinerae]MCG5242454.1 hypothetical protein [Azospirillum doebereinerae]